MFGLRIRLNEKDYNWINPDECYFDNECCIEKSVFFEEAIILSSQNESLNKRLDYLFFYIKWFMDHVKSDYYFYSPNTIFRPMEDGRILLLCKLKFVENRHVEERRKKMEEYKSGEDKNK